ncbi:hypothetical protein [Rikenella microfusus]
MPSDKLSVTFTILLGIVVLGEPADPKTLIGGLMVLAGSILIML